MRSSNSPSHDTRLQTVASRQNARVKELRRLFRLACPNEQGEIAVEGMHLVEEAIRSGLKISAVFFCESARERANRLLPQVSTQIPALILPDDVFSSAVPSETPQGVAAMVRFKTHSIAAVIDPQPALLVIAAGLQDPGNLGTIFRSAEAFGATGILVTERTVSPFNWKAVRASAGSLFRLPWVTAIMPAALTELKARGIRVLATSSHHGSTPISAAGLRRPVAFIVGNEGVGLPKDVLAQADEVIAIPHSKQVESLNAAISASVLLYEAFRQRRAQPAADA